MATKTIEERKKRFETSSNISLPGDFNPSNTASVDYERDLAAPGEYPYTRGIRRNMYRGKFWTMRQYAGFASAEESNARYKYLLSQGTTGLSVAFDLPTQIGLDSDDPLASGEVGKVGVAIDSLEDMLRLLDGIPLNTVSTSMTINANRIDTTLLVSCRCTQAGCSIFKGKRDNSERHSEGVHRQGNLYLSARSFNAADYRYICLLLARGPELEHDFHQWLSYSRGRLDRGAGGCLHTC